MSSIIFDLFETLIDFSLEEYGIMLGQMCDCLSVDKEEFISTWHESWPHYEAGRFENVSEYIEHVSNGICALSAMDAAAAIHFRYEEEILKPRSGVTDVLGQLRKQGCKIGVVTNCPVETPRFWPKTQLAKFVDATVFSPIEKIRKPNPEIFTRCVERLETTPSECLFVGDGANDELNAAQLSGITPVLLNNHDESSKRRLKSWKGLVINDLSEIENILKAQETQSDD